MSPSKKELRARAIAEEKNRRFRNEEQSCPLTRAQLGALLDFLAESGLSNLGTFELTSRWVEERSLDVEGCLSWFRARELNDDYDVALGADPCCLFGPTDDRVATMPLESDQLEHLLDWVDEQVEREGCDHTHRFTTRWLEGASHPVAATQFALMRQGGFCDCEVVANVEPEGIYPRDR